MKSLTSGKTWEKTKVQHLMRHKSGRYYARLFLNGKEVWKSLKTSNASIAEAQLMALRKENREQRGRSVDSVNVKMTFGQAAEIDQKALESELTLKRRTRKYYREVLASLLKSWPGLDETQIRKITTQALKDWAVAYAREYSATRFNGTLSLLRRVLQLAVDRGVIYSNPAHQLERRVQKAKQLELPTRAKFAEFIEAIRTANNRHAPHCGDLAEGLAYTGCRISESAELAWSDLNFETEEIRVKGDPDEQTKNGEIRYVPMIAKAHELFTKMRATRFNEPPSAKVFRVNECQHSMDRAAENVGIARLTHHDLRHFFATICIESDVDIPTVSRWLGHKDGGVLALRTYGHLRREHSTTQAAKVSFDPVLRNPVQVAPLPDQRRRRLRPRRFNNDS